MSRVKEYFGWLWFLVKCLAGMAYALALFLLFGWLSLFKKECEDCKKERGGFEE